MTERVENWRHFLHDLPSPAIDTKDDERCMSLPADEQSTAVTVVSQVGRQASPGSIDKVKADRSSSADRLEPAGENSKSEQSRLKSTVSGFAGIQQVDGTTIHPSTSRISRLHIHNYGYIGTIQVEGNVDLSLVNSEHSKIELLSFSNIATVELKNAGHIEAVHIL